MAMSAETQKVFYLNDLWLHLCWSSSEMMPVFPAHRMLSQAKYMALLRWLMVRQSLSTLSERCMALLAASRASTLFPRRSTVGHKQSISLSPSPLGLEDELRTGCLTLSGQAHVGFQLTDGFTEPSRRPALLQSVAQQGAGILGSSVKAEHICLLGWLVKTEANQIMADWCVPSWYKIREKCLCSAVRNTSSAASYTAKEENCYY